MIITLRIQEGLEGSIWNFRFSSLLLLHRIFKIMQERGLLQTIFQASFPSYFLQLITPIFLMSFWTSSNDLLLDFTMRFFPSGMFLNTFLTAISPGILSTCPNHRKLPFLISMITIGSLYIYQSNLNCCWSSIRYFLLLGQTFFKNIFLSNIAKVLSSLLLSMQTAEPNITIDLFRSIRILVFLAGYSPVW